MALSSLSSRAVQGEFYNRLSMTTPPAWVNQISMFFTSDQASEIYKQLGHVPPMTPWVGPRTASHLQLLGDITIANIDYQSTLEVLVEEIRRDKTGQVQIRLNNQVARAQSHWAKLVTDLMVTGTTALAQDGAEFFATDHKEGNNTTSQDNDLTDSIVLKTAPTAVEMATAIFACVSKIMGYLDNENEPMNEDATSFIVMVPANYMAASAAAITSAVITDSSGSQTNSLAASNFTLQLVVNPRLTATDAFYVYRTDGEGTKAFITQEEVPLRIESQAENSGIEFREKKHEYGIQAIRGVGFGMWQHACLQTFTTT